jgi:hypothetical protein
MYSANDRFLAKTYSIFLLILSTQIVIWRKNPFISATGILFSDLLGRQSLIGRRLPVLLAVL